MAADHLAFGNGKIGGTVWGEVSRERVTFNEETLWTGGPGSSTSYNGGNNETKGQNGATLRALNKQLANGAETVNPGNLTGGENAAEQGNYLNWGDILPRLRVQRYDRHRIPPRPEPEQGQGRRHVQA